MSNGYTQPYQSLNSTAQIIKLPNRRERSKSVERNIWMRLLSKGQLSQNTLTDGEPRFKKSESTFPKVRDPQDLNSTITVQDKMKFSPKPTERSSRSNSRSSNSSSIAPSPTPRTSISRSSLTDSEKSSVAASSGNSIIISNNPAHKTKTTVTVHLRKSSKTSSTPNLLETSLDNEIFEPNRKNTNESLSQSMTNVINPSTTEISRNDTKKFILSRHSQRPLNSIELGTHRINDRNFVTKENSRTNGEKFVTVDNNNSLLGRNLLTSENNRVNSRNFILTNGQPTPFLQSMNPSSMNSSKANLQEEKLELNSLQVFRQPKYKNRDKALRKIKQLEHLSKNESCNEVVNQLEKGIQPNVYENQHPLKLVEFINKEGFVTTSRTISPVKKQSPNKSAPTPVTFNRVRREHIYSEIGEAEHNSSRVHTPTFQKKVTFRTFHEPIQEGDPFALNKKILPAKFWGIVEVTQALRSRTDEERRKIAKLCYHAILTGSSHSSKFFGKVDNSRWGEIAYVLLMETSFEVRDSEGFLMAKHEFSDISVLYQPEEDSNIFVYIGRCKFNGRIGIALRLNKTKYTESIINAFKNKK